MNVTRTAIPSSTRVLGKRGRWYRIAKRLMDLGICAAALPFALPVMALIALVIMIDSPGAPIFVQVRMGKRGTLFNMYKFRTMRCHHDDQADRAYMQAYVAGKLTSHEMPTRPLYKPLNRQHITRVGGFLRHTSLDELPQIFNVLSGEMSLVGPRPNVPYEADVYQWWHEERLSVLPGITGMAQIHGRSSLTFDLIVRYDILYVRNRSLGLDAKILWRTLLSVFTGRGAG